MMTHASSTTELLTHAEAILFSMLDPVISTDHRGIITTASASVRRVFGYEPSELIGRNVSILMPEPYRSAHDGYMASYLRTGKSHVLGVPREFTGVRKDGREFPVEISVSRLDLPGAEHPHFVGVLRDITSRRRSEEDQTRHQDDLERLVAERTTQLRQADRLMTIGTLAAGLGHDLNNIVFPARCRLDALDARRLPDDVREQIHSLRHLLAYLQQLSEGLRLLALDPADAEARPASTDLAAWWGRVGGLLRWGVRKRGELTADIPEGLPPIALAEHRLTQAVLNLIVNAGEAIGERGRVVLAARLTPCGRMVRLSVRDDGAGMSEDVRRRAIEPFFTTKPRGLGTGLGLSIVRGIVNGARGTMQIDSAPGRGTTVTLAIPVAGAPAPAPAGATNGLRGPLCCGAASPHPCAAVTLSDPRLASLVVAFIESSGLSAASSAPGESGAADRDEPPGGACLWVTEPTADSCAVAPRFALGDPRRRIVLLGPGGPEWRALGALEIDDPSDFEAVREGLSRAIAAVRGDSAP